MNGSHLRPQLHLPLVCSSCHLDVAPSTAWLRGLVPGPVMASLPPHSVVGLTLHSSPVVHGAGIVCICLWVCLRATAGRIPAREALCPWRRGSEAQFTWGMLQGLLPPPLAHHVEEDSSEEENDGQEGQHRHQG